MPNAIWFISYKLKNGVSVDEFMRASEKCNNEVLSQQKGFISWKVLRHGETWVDLVEWETEEDAKNGETAGEHEPASHEFYSHIDLDSCTLQLYTVEKTH